MKLWVVIEQIRKYINIDNGSQISLKKMLRSIELYEYLIGTEGIRLFLYIIIHCVIIILLYVYYSFSYIYIHKCIYIHLMMELYEY